MLQEYGREMDCILEGNLESIGAPIDYLGVNYYTRMIARSKEITEEQNAPRQIPEPENLTEMGWEVYPSGLFEILDRIHREYPFPAFMVTENGAAFSDRMNAEGEVNDPDRIHYLAEHVKEVGHAIQAGIPLLGYFAWSLMDNFEWAHGYSKRFGLVHVDYETLQRTPKRSAQWYRELIASGILPSEP